MFWMIGENILGVIMRSESYCKSLLSLCALILVRFSCILGADLESISEYIVGMRNRLSGTVKSSYPLPLLDLELLSI